ncbi:F0F1 ATP synthase subunit delta [Patescibacteria group bacterium]|nr:F0F1 ATP synthase subunit delta [Patescibacteria group bacterium]
MPTPHQITAGFIDYLKEQELYEQLPAVVHELEAELSRNQDITVISANEIAPSDRIGLEKELTKKWGEHRIVYTVDPILISGLIVRFKDQVIDLSGKSSLTDLAYTLNK